MSVNKLPLRGTGLHTKTRICVRRTSLAIGIAAFIGHAAIAQDTVPAGSGPGTAAPQTPQPTEQQAAPNGNGGGTQSTKLGGVTVSAQRMALKKALDRKKNSDKISDSIVSDDMGKLPDNSVTEALQRVPGVSIAHFPTTAPGANVDYDHFTAEGGGLLVRGLNQVNSTLNGQESFSANGGRTLSFEDVTPELIAGVDVYKSQSADLLEGGIGGTVDLRTHMPFDFKGSNYALSTKYNYSDLADQARPEASALLSNRWKTGLGEFGALVDVAYSDLASANNTIGVDPYFAQPMPGTSTTTYVPGGVGWRVYNFDRKRLGLYSGLQWKPDSDFLAHFTYFRSNYRSKSIAQEAATSFGNSSVPNSAGTNIYDGNGALVYTSAMQTKSCNDPFLYSGSTCTDSPSAFDPGLIGTDTSVAWQSTTTADYTLGFKWNPSDRLTVKSDIQLVRSDEGVASQAIFLYDWVPSYSVDLRGDLPQIKFNGSDPADPVQANCSYGGSDYAGCGWGWQATMDHIEHHVGQLAAWHYDMAYDLSDTGFVRTLQAGARFARRTDTDDISTYNWQALGADFFRYYQPAQPPQAGYNPYYLSYIAGNHYRVPPSNYTSLFAPKNFMRGKANLPAQVWTPSVSLVEGYPGNVAALHQMLGAPNDGTGPITYAPDDLNNIIEKTYDAYALARFADDTSFGVPMNGNVGVRFVGGTDDINGYELLPSNTGVLGVPGYPSTVAYPFPGGAYPRGAKTSDTHVLPSLNVQWLLTPQTHLRFALSQAVNRPSFIQLSPDAQVSVNTLANNQFSGFTGSDAGNPDLRPETANQVDLALEWYGDKDSAAHVSMFYKDIHNYILTGLHNETINVTFPSLQSGQPGPTLPVTVAVTEPFNADRATIEGFEIGGQKYFSALPGAFKGLGVNANFTYIDGSSPDEVGYDVAGNPITNLPLQGLSKYTLNFTGMYDYGPWSARLAYNWRSQWLASLNNNGTTGTVTYAGYNNGNPVSYALPTFVRAYGQLDAFASYKFNEHALLVIEASNLTDAITRTLVGAGTQQHGRDWFMTDRRIGTSLRFTF